MQFEANVCNVCNSLVIKWERADGAFQKHAETHGKTNSECFNFDLEYYVNLTTERHYFE